jgi:hypothetical protein
MFQSSIFNNLDPSKNTVIRDQDQAGGHRVRADHHVEIAYRRPVRSRSARSCLDTFIRAGNWQSRRIGALSEDLAPL